MSKPRINNLFGALMLSVNDRVANALCGEMQETSEAFAAIITIGNSPGHTVDWLSRILSLTHSGTVRLLTRLETEQLVGRRASQYDARSVAIHLTASGEKRMQELLLARRRAIDHALDALSANEQQTLCTLIERMLGALTNNDIGDRMCRLCEERACPQAKCPITLACTN